MNHISKHIKAAKDGDQDEIEWLFNHYEPKIQMIVDHFMSLPNPGIVEPEELIQECHIGLVNCLNDDCPFAKSVFTYMLNEVRRYYRHAHSFVRIPSYIYDKYPDQAKQLVEKFEIISLEDIMDCHDIASLDLHNQPHFEDAIEKCRANLTEKQFNILYLYFVEEYTLELIGQKYNVTRERIRQIIEKSLEICRSTLGDKYD